MTIRVCGGCNGDWLICHACATDSTGLKDVEHRVGSEGSNPVIVYLVDSVQEVVLAKFLLLYRLISHLIITDFVRGAQTTGAPIEGCIGHRGCSM